MSNIPDNIQEVSNRMRSDVQATLPESNPFLIASVLDAIIKASAARHYDNYQQLLITFLNLFPSTATGTALEAWGSYRGITRNPATQSTGPVTAQGNPGTLIPAGTLFTTLSAQQFESTASANISTQVVSVVEITLVGQTATATTASNHNFASGIAVTVSGADQVEYDGTYTVVVISATEFQYQITGAPASPATGAISVTSDIATVSLQSVDFGADTNLLAGTQLVIGTPIAGLNNNVYVQVDEIGGGTDIESDEDLKSRIDFVWQNPITPFNAAQITLTCREVPGVTRVFVNEITPNVGDVTIYFTRDNDENIIPSGSEVDTVKQKIIDEILPANTSAESSLFVLAPNGVPVDFSFLSITPNTQGMRDAINNNLSVFFREKTSVGQNISRIEYECAILQSIDLDSGQPLQTFTLATPTTDIIIAQNELGILGNISYT